MGETFDSIAKREHVPILQIHRWCKYERWKELIVQVQPILRETIAKETAEDVAMVKLKHAADAKTLRARAMSMLDGFPIKTIYDSSGQPTEVYGHPSPSDMRLLVAAVKEASDLELERLDAAPVTGRYDLGFPGFESMLEDIWNRKKKELPAGFRAEVTDPSDSVRATLTGRRRPRPIVDEPATD